MPPAAMSTSWALPASANSRCSARRPNSHSQVFGARFAVANRSLLLVNDVHDRRTYPLATFENLRTAVNAIGRRMHPDRDTLGADADLAWQ